VEGADVSAPVFSAGTIVAGRYTIESLLGKRRGRATYRAICAPNRHVALKVLDPLLAGSEEERALVQAATVASELPEGAVLGMIDHGIDAESGAPFLVSPLSDHPSLEAFVSLCPLSLTEMATMARSLARGLDAAHRRGLAHLAIRPTNVFVGPPPVCWTRVSDFGAGAVDRGTEEGGERDTLAFAAPELYATAQGPLSADAAARADVFSAALLCFYAATGDTYWKATRKKGGGTLGPDIQPLVKETGGVRAPTSVAAKEIGVAWDPKLDAAFARALSHSPASRFGSVGELAEAFADALNLPSRAGAANLTDRLFGGGGGVVPPTVAMDDDDDGPATSVKNVPRIAPPAPSQQLESVAPPPESIAPAGPRMGAGISQFPPEAPREARWGGTLVMELDGPSGPPPRTASGTMQALPREMTGPFQVPQGLPREMTGPFQVPQGLRSAAARQPRHAVGAAGLAAPAAPSAAHRSVDPDARRGRRVSLPRASRWPRPARGRHHRGRHPDGRRRRLHDDA
jgi:serine/threonine protein kinase